MRCPSACCRCSTAKFKPRSWLILFYLSRLIDVDGHILLELFIDIFLLDLFIQVLEVHEGFDVFVPLADGQVFGFFYGVGLRDQVAKSFFFEFFLRLQLQRLVQAESGQLVENMIAAFGLARSLIHQQHDGFILKDLRVCDCWLCLVLKV